MFRPSLFTIHFWAHYSLFIIKKEHYSLIIIPHPDSNGTDKLKKSIALTL